MKMKLKQSVLEGAFISSGARALRVLCVLSMIFCVLCMALSVMGRQTFDLVTESGSYEDAIYAEKDHEPAMRGLTVSMSDQVHVRAGDPQHIQWTIQVGLSLMYALDIVPFFIACWFLYQVFSNIIQKKIFVEENASCLFYYGVLQCGVSVLAPFLKIFISFVVNQVSADSIYVSTGSGLLSGLIPGIAFIIASYIIHYGIYLLDEVDHTL